MSESVPRMRTAPVALAAARSVTILGATGSIGASTIDLIRRNRAGYRLEAVSANRNASALARIAREFDARFAAVADPSAYRDLKSALAGTGIETAAGAGAMIEAARRPPRWGIGAGGRGDRGPATPGRGG